MAILNDISWYRGDDATVTLTVVDGNNNVVNVTGWNTQLSLRDQQDQSLLYQVAGNNVNPTAGVITYPIPNSLTNASGAVDTGPYDYDIRRTDTGNQGVLSIGQAVVLPDVGV